MSKNARHKPEHKSEHHDLSSLAEDTQALMTATADVAGENVAEARKRLSDALANAREKVVKGAKSTDKAVRENPYVAAGIGLGVGVLLGWYIGHRSSRDK